jgi:iron(III) transport system permease protein
VFNPAKPEDRTFVSYVSIGQIQPSRILAGAAAAVVLILFLLWPVGLILFYPTLPGALRVLANEHWFEALWHSMAMAVLASGTATMLGLAYAYALVRIHVRWSKLLHAVALLPILAPPFVISISYILLFGRNGLVTRQLLQMRLDIYGWKGLWLVQTLTFFPLAYLTLANVLRAIPGNLEQAASNLGASNGRVFRDVTMPLLRPGLVASMLLVGISVLADFGNPVIIAGDYSMLPTLAYLKVTGWFDLDAASVLASLLLAPTVVLFLIQRVWLGHRSYVTVSGKSPQQSHPPAPLWLVRTVLAVTYAAAGVIALVYGILAYGSISRAWGYDYRLTLRHFAQLGRRGPSIINTMHYSFWGAVLSVLLATAFAYLVMRRKIVLPGMFDFFTTVPAAIPGMFLGLGYVVAFNHDPIRLTGTSFIIILALGLWNLPTAYRYAMANLAQLSDQLEYAAANLGATPLRVLSSITTPLLRGALLAGGTVTFLRNVTCLSVIIFLVTPRTPMATTDVLALVEGGEWGQAASLSVVLLGIALTLLLGGIRIIRSFGQELEL